jgi:hypothetical protein
MSFPALEHLMGAYFHLDWNDEYTDERAAVEDFISGEPQLVTRLPREIELVLNQFESDDDLAAFLRDIDSCYTTTPEQGGYRGWLTSIAERVRTATATE